MRLASAKWIVSIGFIFVFLPCDLAFGSTAQWSNGYTYRRAITIDHTKVPNTDQTNFPALISGTYSYLATTSNGGNVTNLNGYDIIFTTDGAGTNVLPYERDTYNASTGAVNFWVQIPTLSHTSDTVIYMFYGNSSVTTDQSQPTQVWSGSYIWWENYQGIWHLGNGTTLSGSDSTYYNDSLTNNNGVVAATGKIGGAASFNGTNNYLSNSSPVILAGSSITISFWNYVTSAEVQNSAAFSIGNSNTPNRIQANAPWSDSNIYWDYGTYTGGRVSASYSSHLGAWTYVTLEYNANTTTHAIYLNGQLVASSVNSTTPTSNQTGIDIGAWPGAGLYDHATIDDFRVSALARSGDWIATEYNNQSSPSTFYTIESADSQGSNSYSYSRPITIDHTKVPNTDQPSFPVLISGTYSYLATTANGGNVTNTSGYDIIFTSDPAGANMLPFERESYNASTGAVLFWVQVPLISHTTDTVFYMFYGNSSVTADQTSNAAAWDSNYKAVWHYGNGSTLSVADSTVNGNNGTNNGATATTGEVDGAAALNGSSQYIDYGSGNGLAVSRFTISAWVNLNSTLSDLAQIYVKRDPNAWWNVNGMLVVNTNGTLLANFVRADQTSYVATCTSDLRGAGWKYVVGTYDGANLQCYVNAVQQATVVAAGDPSTGGSQLVRVGKSTLSGENRYFPGSLDEIRVSSAARSADWITTEYNNQSSPSTFYTIGSVGSGGPESWGPTITSLSPASGSVDTPITITGTNFGLTQNGGIVNFNGVIATVMSWSSTSIVALVPDGATSGNVTIRISGVTSNGASFTVTGPVISTLAPTQGPVGTSVVITGTGFGSTQGSSTVKFNGTTATASSWTATSITVTVPTGASSGGVIVTVSNVPSDDAPFTVTTSAPSTSDIYYYFSDGLGTTRVITASDGTICYDADLYPYGGLRSYNSTCGPTQMFTTYERDPESNNDYAMARYFSSRLGRFMSPDPLWDVVADPANPQSWNRYAYALNNPLRYVDPTGTDACGEVLDDIYYDDGECDSGTGDNGSSAIDCLNEDCTSIAQTITVTADQPDLIDTLESDINNGLQWLNDFSTSFNQINPNDLIAPLNRCAAANAASLKSVAKSKSNGWAANTFFGNDFSTISNLIFGPNRAAAAGSMFVSNPTPANLTYQTGKAFANSVGVMTTTTTSATVSTPAYQLTATITETSTKALAQTAAGQGLGKIIGFISAGKLAFDYAAYTYAEIGCAIR